MVRRSGHLAGSLRVDRLTRTPCGRERSEMRILVDRELCEANALCMASAPEIFRVEDDDTLTLLMHDVPDRLMSAVEEAIRLCPRQALRQE